MAKKRTSNNRASGEEDHNVEGEGGEANAVEKVHTRSQFCPVFLTLPQQIYPKAVQLLGKNYREKASRSRDDDDGVGEQLIKAEEERGKQQGKKKKYLGRINYKASPRFTLVALKAK